MDGQAQAPESDGIDSLADFLSDEPAAESEELATADESTSDGDDSEAKPQTDEETEEEVEGETDTEAKEAKPTTEEIEVTIKGEDGSDTTVKVTKDELVKGYQRQADYTRKTQALGDRETQAVQVFQQKHSELRDSYLQRADFASQAIAQMAGFRSDDEMAQLAATDPSLWVQENQRQHQIKQILGTLEQQTQAERKQAELQAKQNHEAELKSIKTKSWAELEKVGIDAPKLEKTYIGVMKAYGYEPKDFANVTDHRLVKMMVDAMAFRELKAKAPAVTQKAKDAPRMPTKQNNVAATQRKSVQEARFRSGKASLNDLADYLT